MTLYFDLKEECMKDDMPSLPPEPCHYGYVLVLARGYMNLAGFESGEFSVCVFRLKEDYSSPRWVHMHSIDLRSLTFQTAFDKIGCPYTYKIEDLFSARYEYIYSIIHLIEDNEDDMAFDPMSFLGYKVICIFDGMNSKNKCFQTMTYSSESGVWKCGCSFRPTFPVDFHRSTYFKDLIYWIVSKTILRFDLKEEYMKDDTLPFPPEPCHYGYVLVPACGYMNLVGFESGEFSVCNFRLKEDYSSPRWVHMHSIDLRPLIFQTAFDRIGCPYTYRSDDLFCVRYGYVYSIINLIEDNEDDMVKTIEGNDYLLTQILIRVPLKDIITFKCVSKRWFSLITNHFFSRCLATVKQRVSDAVFIYNPTIEDKKTLPSCFPLFDPLNLHYSLAFDPMRFLGYKVICIFDGVNSKNQSFQTIIYSSESGVWKRGCSFLPTFLVDFRRATYFKDSIYWIGSKTTLRFDLKEECMKDDMPSLSPEPCHYGYILAPACDYMNLAGFESGEFSVCVFWLKEDFSSPKIGCPYTYRSDDLFSVRYEYHYSIIHLIEDNEDDMGLLIHLMDKVVVLPVSRGILKCGFTFSLFGLTPPS
ncbi:hypothetical protein Ahy_B01g056240 [Arachis hypogaea]|uniref:F-box domain-containing protein n=1 Tax=Arachis hypogaea TaxID=3818 RepID=A0A445AYI1_ARAHY|nr:hypothetical protein Ahy_B01g056240 [Arachis hypogaea]